MTHLTSVINSNISTKTKLSSCPICLLLTRPLPSLHRFYFFFVLPCNRGIEYEVSFIRLIEKLSNGAVIEINKTGTTLYFCPGTLIGGSITHQCDNERSIGYYLEPLVMLAPFMKESLSATLLGITTDDHDIGVDAIRSMLLPYVSKFIGTEDGLDLKIVSRGCAPLGGGEVVFTCPKVSQLSTIVLFSFSLSFSFFFFFSFPSFPSSSSSSSSSPSFFSFPFLLFRNYYF